MEEIESFCSFPLRLIIGGFLLNRSFVLILLIRYIAHYRVKSVQSALSDLLTTSATHNIFSRPSGKRGLILIGLELNTNARESFVCQFIS